MNTLQNTNKVSAQISNSTNSVIVKMSRVTYGHIIGNTLTITRKATDMVMHSLRAFASKNNLSINF
jgi:hypothetical protein